MSNWTIWLPAFRHSQALLEIAEAVLYGLRANGQLAELSPAPRPGTRHIVFDAHRLLLAGSDPLPADSIIYQTEVPSSGWWVPSYIAKLSAHTIWEYSPDNLPAYERHGLARPAVVRPGWVAELERIQRAARPDIDVLFYGSPNERRQHVLGALLSHGLRVVHLMGVYGAERDAYLARAHVVLSLHFYEGAPLEEVRTFYPDINRIPVVAEGRVPYDTIVPTCLAVHASNPATWSNPAYQNIRALPMADQIAAALETK